MSTVFLNEKFYLFGGRASANGNTDSESLTEITLVDDTEDKVPSGSATIELDNIGAGRFCNWYNDEETADATFITTSNQFAVHKTIVGFKNLLKRTSFYEKQQSVEKLISKISEVILNVAKAANVFMIQDLKTK
jgi:hypothetical protein